MPGVAALVVNWNGGPVLAEALASLPAAGIPHGRTLLVDNASTDGSGREAAARFPGTVFLETGGELSFAAANNLGLRHLASDPPEAVLFANNDAVLTPYCADRLLETMSADPALGAVAPLITDGTGKVWYAGGNVDWKEAGGRLRGKGEEDRPSFHHPAKVGFATLCVLMVRWEALRQVGLLDETYGFYDEDLEFCLRLAAGGWGIAFEPAATAVHRCGWSTAGRGEAFVYRHMARNRLMTMRRFGTPARWAAFLPWFGAMMAKKSVLFALRGRGGVARAIAAGLRDGLRDPHRPVPRLDEPASHRAPWS